VLIISTLEVEKKAIFDCLTNEEVAICKLSSNPEISLSRILLPSKINDDDTELLVYQLSEKGNVIAAIETTCIVVEHEPDLVVLVGICGGLQKGNGVSLGDIIVANSVVYYERGKALNKVFLRELMKIDVDEKIIQTTSSLVNGGVLDYVLSNLKPKTPRVLFKSMASGEKVIASSEMRSTLRKLDDHIVAVEMESYGVAKSVKIVRSNLTSFLVVKSIGDWADETKNDDFQVNAARNSAKFSVELIKNISLDKIKI